MQVWRRRSCKVCKAIFTTVEGVELAGSLMVRSRTGQLVPFERDMLFVSIYSTLKHRTDAVSAANALTATVIAKLRKSAQGATINHSSIVETCHQVLDRFDTAAGVQYSAYHKS
jgi:transcriptional regulator NrdR family protein